MASQPDAGADGIDGLQLCHAVPWAPPDIHRVAAWQRRLPLNAPIRGHQATSEEAGMTELELLKFVAGVAAVAVLVLHCWDFFE